jgi:hypothetical protein
MAQQLHSRESATLPSAGPLSVMLKITMHKFYVKFMFEKSKS